jgi:hypothetical protein
MITIFTPMILKNESAMIAPNTSIARKRILLGLLLGLYPFGQFVGSPIMVHYQTVSAANPCC